MTLNNDDEKIVKLRKKVCDVESYAQDVVTKLSRWLLSKEEKLLTLKTTWLLSSLFFVQLSPLQSVTRIPRTQKIGFVSGYLIGSLCLGSLKLSSNDCCVIEVIWYL